MTRCAVRSRPIGSYTLWVVALDRGDRAGNLAKKNQRPPVFRSINGVFKGINNAVDLTTALQSQADLATSFELLPNYSSGWLSDE